MLKLSVKHFCVVSQFLCYANYFIKNNDNNDFLQRAAILNTFNMLLMLRLSSPSLQRL